MRQHLSKVAKDKKYNKIEGSNKSSIFTGSPLNTIKNINTD